MIFDQGRFVIEGIEVAAGTGAENHQDLFCFGFEVRLSSLVGSCRIDRGADGSFVVLVGERSVAMEHIEGSESSQRHAAESHQVVCQKRATA